MADRMYSDEEKSNHRRILQMVSGSEQKFLYNFGYGALFIFLCVIRTKLHSGSLLGITSMFTIVVFFMWIASNPIVHKYHIYGLIRGNEPESVIKRYFQFKRSANIFGLVSVLGVGLAWCLIVPN